MWFFPNTIYQRGNCHLDVLVLGGREVKMCYSIQVWIVLTCMLRGEIVNDTEGTRGQRWLLQHSGFRCIPRPLNDYMCATGWNSSQQHEHTPIWCPEYWKRNIPPELGNAFSPSNLYQRLQGMERKCFEKHIVTPFMSIILWPIYVAGGKMLKSCFVAGWAEWCPFVSVFKSKPFLFLHGLQRVSTVCRFIVGRISWSPLS